MLTKREAIKAGQRRGAAAASWVFDGNTTRETYAAFLKGDAEGDPAILDAYSAPAWLSGEWAGESISELLGECRNARDEARLADVMDVYCVAADAAYYRELQRVARFHVEGR